MDVDSELYVALVCARAHRERSGRSGKMRGRVCQRKRRSRSATRLCCKIERAGISTAGASPKDPLLAHGTYVTEQLVRIQHVDCIVQDSCQHHHKSLVNKAWPSIQVSASPAFLKFAQLSGIARDIRQHILLLYQKVVHLEPQQDKTARISAISALSAITAILPWPTWQPRLRPLTQLSRLAMKCLQQSPVHRVLSKLPRKRLRIEHPRNTGTPLPCMPLNEPRA